VILLLPLQLIIVSLIVAGTTYTTVSAQKTSGAGSGQYDLPLKGDRYVKFTPNPIKMKSKL